MVEPRTTITRAIKEANGSAICAYLTGGYPSPEAFGKTLRAIASSADVVEVGVPFSDPMADGLTIQESSRVSLETGINLTTILDELESMQLAAPHVLMGYFNPFMAFGLERLADRMLECGTAGLIVPDLPLEESKDLRALFDTKGLALVQLVAPTTPTDRIERIADASSGFVYAVAATGTTGGSTEFDQDTVDYLDRVKAASVLPVLAGFGVRSSQQVEKLRQHVDGVVVGSALIDAIDQRKDPAEFLSSLRPTEVPA